MPSPLFFLRIVCVTALMGFSLVHAQSGGIFEVSNVGELSTLPAYVRSAITSIPAGAEIVLERNAYGSFTSGVLKYKNLSVNFSIGDAGMHAQNYTNALHVVDDYMKIAPEISRLLNIPVPVKPLEIKNTFWTLGDGTGYGARPGETPDILQFTHNYNEGAAYSGGLSHELVHFMEEYCPAASSRTSKFALCETLSTAIESKYNPAGAFFEDRIFFPLYDNAGRFQSSRFQSAIGALVDPSAYQGGLSQDVYWSSRLLMDEMAARSGLSGDLAIARAKELIDKARSVAGADNVARELGFSSFKELNAALEKRFLATHPATVRFPVTETPPPVMVYDRPIPNPSQKEIVASIERNAKANAELIPCVTPTGRSTAGAGIRTFARRTGAAIGFAGIIMAAHDFSTTSADERVVAGFLQQMRQCANSLPNAPDEGFFDALQDQFPAWAMNLGADDIGRMVMGKDFDGKFAEEFASGMEFIKTNCPSVWNGIKTSPKLAPFRQATLDWLGRIPEIHGPLVTEVGPRPTSWLDYMPWSRSSVKKKNSSSPVFRGRGVTPPFEGVVTP